MRTVAVIGAGDIGGATVHALAASGVVGRITIVDRAAKVAAGKALDLQQAGAIAAFHTTLEGTDDLSRVTGSTVCIIADEFGHPPREWSGDEGLAMLKRLAPAVRDVPLVFAGPAQCSLLELAAEELGMQSRLLVGSAPEAFAGAVRAMVALEAACSPTEVSLSVLGKPPGGLVVAWSESTIGGHSLATRVDAARMARLAARVNRLWPPGAYTLGLAAARVAGAALTTSRRTLSVIAMLDGAFGVRRGAGIVSAELSPAGIARTWIPELSSRERVQVMSALGDGTAHAR
jgi:malate dehydrogenase